MKNPLHRHFFIGLLAIAFFNISCEKLDLGNQSNSSTADLPQVKKESHYRMNDSTLYQTIEYTYNADGKVAVKQETHYLDTLSNKTTKYTYNSQGKLASETVYQTGWTEDLQPIEVAQKNNYYYENDLLTRKVTYVDSVNRGYSQEKYFYSDGQLDSIEHTSYDVRQDLAQSNMEYFRYNGNLLLENGYDRNNEKDRNTIYNYSSGLLTSKQNRNWITRYEYEYRMLVYEYTQYGDYTGEEINYHYAGQLLRKKIISRYTMYSIDPYQPYSTVEITYEY